jgi:hypothetical protein
MIAGLAGCSGNRTRGGTNTSMNATSGTLMSSTTTSSETSTSTPNRETPPADFAPEWSFNADVDWTERQRLTEYPDSDEAVDWTPDYALSTEYAHVPSRKEIASMVDATNVPPLICAVLSKWKFSTALPNTSVDFVAEVRGWFMDQFNTFTFDFGSPVTVEPFSSELDSGRVVGSDSYELVGDTGQLDSPFQATVDDKSVEVERVRYEAEGVLMGFVDRKEHSGFLAGSAWPAEDSVTLHTAESGEIDIFPTVSGESWNIEDSLFDVLNEIDQS